MEAIRLGLYNFFSDADFAPLPSARTGKCYLDDDDDDDDANPKYNAKREKEVGVWWWQCSSRAAG